MEALIFFAARFGEDDDDGEKQCVYKNFIGVTHQMSKDDMHTYIE